MQIASDLSNDTLISGFLEGSDDDRPCIGFGVCTCFPEPLRGPQPKKLISAGNSLEAQRLFVRKLAFECFPAFGKLVHSYFLRMISSDSSSCRRFAHIEHGEPLQLTGPGFPRNG